MTDFTPTSDQLRILSQMLECDYPTEYSFDPETETIQIKVSIHDVVDWDYVYNCDSEDEDPRMLDNIQILRNQNKI